MGSQHSHDKGPGEPESVAGSRRGSSRRSSGGGGGEGGGEKPPQAEKPQPPSLVPIDKLAKLLVQKSQKEDGVNGITENSVIKYIFPSYPELARRFYRAAAAATAEAGGGGGRGGQGLSPSAFRHHCERVLALIDDTLIIDTYVRMFSEGGAEGARVDAATFRQLLYTSYRVSVDHYPDGPQTCLSINKTLDSVVSGCFGEAEEHSAGYVARWLQEHVPRVLLPVHRYVVHVVTTRHRVAPPSPPPPLSPPVLDEAGAGAGAGEGAGAGGLAPSQCWLLAAALPPLYSRPPAPPPPPPPPHAHDRHTEGSASTAAAAWISRLVCALPSHWAPLYRARQHGLGANRFLHHTLQYRGPTLVILECSAVRAVVASAQEWRETHQYWGGPECALLLLYPRFTVLERGAKMLYLNTHIRGYPLGLRAGSDPRRPRLAVNADFDKMTLDGTEHDIYDIEVWGCGDSALRETQQDIKKWQVKEAERQRQIKISAADWIDHPDRYLLEMAGRPQYNNSSK